MQIPQVLLARKVIGGLLRKAGYQPVPIAMLHELGLVLHLQKLFRTQRIDAVFDVGANHGQFYRLVRNDAQFHGHVLSFEPIPELHRALTERSEADRKWHVFPFALGAADEQKIINVMKLDDLSSFLDPNVERTERFRDSNKPKRLETVDIKRLDDIFAAICHEHGIERPYLKMDTQGYDLNVLKAAQRRWARSLHCRRRHRCCRCIRTCLTGGKCLTTSAGWASSYQQCSQ